jgi:hypothetical protein
VYVPCLVGGMYRRVQCWVRESAEGRVSLCSSRSFGGHVGGTSSLHASGSSCSGNGSRRGSSTRVGVRGGSVGTTGPSQSLLSA